MKKNNIINFPKKRKRKPVISKNMRRKRRKAKIRRRITSLLVLGIIILISFFINSDRGVRLDAPLISQKPELYNGCEITSIAMLLSYKQIKVDKMILAKEMKKDTTELKKDEEGIIKVWGNPQNGFVGDVTGLNGIGYSIDPIALEPLINEYFDKGALNLTGNNTKDLKKSLKLGNPIVVWVTADLTRPKEFQQWKDESGEIVEANFNIHAILLTGYDKEYFYYNDPLASEKDRRIRKKTFEAIWKDMGSKAITVNY